jgi:hypothetical protein
MKEEGSKGEGVKESKIGRSPRHAEVWGSGGIAP